MWAEIRAHTFHSARVFFAVLFVFVHFGPHFSYFQLSCKEERLVMYDRVGDERRALEKSAFILPFLHNLWYIRIPVPSVCKTRK